jgi:predicted DNA-binding protein (UPF0251 family)
MKVMKRGKWRALKVAEKKVASMVDKWVDK